MTSKPIDLWGLEPGEETTALCWYKRWGAGIRLWDGRAPKEPTEKVTARHEEARIICRRCPLIAACEQALSAMERQGLRVDGVMAGRYCDVREALGSSENRFRQSECRGCQVPLIPMGPHEWRVKPPASARPHLGEGLCEECYPQLAVFRFAPEAAARSYQLNNPIGSLARRSGAKRRREVG